MWAINKMYFSGGGFQGIVYLFDLVSFLICFAINIAPLHLFCQVTLFSEWIMINNPNSTQAWSSNSVLVVPYTKKKSFWPIKHRLENDFYMSDNGQEFIIWSKHKYIKVVLL